uniref:Putative short-chain dehydrogenase n=1 Tax=Leptospirillum sp. Group II '5-way CG' TaxID=419541 RepID=B6AR46_9BACT|nr:MAG: Putative short-chain dehydrogenase [Leptospirillum sp. Group II '5-way CG']
MEIHPEYTGNSPPEKTSSRTPLFSRIFLTGASSGLGKALALESAHPGVSMGLLARRTSLLESLAGEIRKKGVNVITYTGDVRDKTFLQEAGMDFQDRYGVPDCLIVNAGIRGPLYAGMADRCEEDVMETNFHGARNTILPFLPGMTSNRNGSILVISSLASYLALPEAGGYCASKAALNLWCGSLRYDLKQHGVTLTLVNPGFIRTEMTRDNPYPMPFVLEPEKAAQLILKAARKKKSVYSFPPGLAWPLRFLGSLPMPTREFLLSRILRRKHPPRT